MTITSSVSRKTKNLNPRNGRPTSKKKLLPYVSLGSEPLIVMGGLFLRERLFCEPLIVMGELFLRERLFCRVLDAVDWMMMRVLFNRSCVMPAV